MSEFKKKSRKHALTKWTKLWFLLPFRTFAVGRRRIFAQWRQVNKLPWELDIWKKKHISSCDYCDKKNGRIAEARIEPLKRLSRKNKQKTQEKSPADDDDGKQGPLIIFFTSDGDTRVARFRRSRWMASIGIWRQKGSLPFVNHYVFEISE